MLATSLLCSCELVNVLDKEPPHNLTPESAIKDEKSAETAMVGVYGNQIAYDAYMTIGNGAFMTGTLKANDNPGVTVNIYYIESRLPKLNIITDAYTPFWNYPTTVINSANRLLVALEGMSDDQFTNGRRMAMMAEAKFLRAFSNFDMLRMFGEYDKMDSKFGMILRKKPATVSTVALARSSVRETYEFILEDLDYAIKYAPDFKVPYVASKMAAKALRIRTLFYMGDYPAALTEANDFISANLRTLESDYATIFTNKENSEMIFTRGIGGSSEIDGQATRIQAYHNQGKWGPTASFLALVAGDPREDVILKDGVGKVFGTQKTINKAANAEGDMPIYYMRYSEIYMIKAECQARMGNPGGALATLNQMRTAHGLGTIGHSDDILDTLLKEWILEMGFENGHEWNALWRLGGVNKLMVVNQTVKEECDKSSDPEIYKTSLPFKRIYPIPSTEISANKLSIQNPGYN